MELNSNSYVMLGTLSMGRRSGYEIKAVLDKSARFFWAASYSQIYPELKRLDQAGLIEGTEAAEGGRRKIVYEITAKGREALREWLREPPEIFEMRDEGLLKLFFANAASPADAVQTLRVIRERREEMEQQLKALVPKTAAMASVNPYPHLVLKAGIEYARLFAEWCATTEMELQKQLHKPPNQPKTIDGDGTTPKTTDPTERTPDV